MSTLSSVQRTNFTYAAHLLENRLSCAYHAGKYMVFGNPRDTEESADGLKKVTYEKRNEVYRNLSANEEGFVGGAPALDC